MSTLKELFDSNLSSRTELVNKADQDSKASEARVAVQNAITLQKLIDKLGPDADTKSNVKLFQETNKQTLANKRLVEKLDSMDDPDELLRLAANPKPFMNTLEAEEARDVVKGSLELLAQNENYTGMVDYVLDIANATNDPYFTAKGQGITDYVQELLKPRELTEEEQKNPELAANPPLIDDNIKAFKGFTEEFTRRNAAAGMNGIRVSQKFEELIRGGVYPETALINDDPKLPRKLGTQMMFNQTPVGKTLRAFDGAFRLINGGIRTNVTVDGQDAGTYFDGKRQLAVQQQLKQNFPERLNKLEAKLEAGDDLAMGEGLLDIINPPSEQNDIDGFTLRSGAVPQGQSPFASVPAAHTKYLDMPEGLLLFAEQIEKDRLTRKKSADRELQSFGSYAKPLADELDAIKPEVPSAAYSAMRQELENFQKVGQAGYKYLGKINEQVGAALKESQPVTLNQANNALSRLKDAATDYAKENPEFAEKINAFDWEQRQRFRAAYAMPKQEASLDFIAKVKKHRGIEESFDPERYYATSMAGIPDKFQAAQKKFNDGKLWLRGSSAYDEVGKAMEELGKRLDRMKQDESSIRTTGRSESLESQRIMKANAEAVQEQLKVLKEKTAAYYKHKITDGRSQWKKGTNKNADSRIEAVQGLDDFAAELGVLIGNRINMSSKNIRNELESRTPDYDTWCELYPKNVDAYKKAGEPVPDGLGEYEKNVSGIRQLNNNMISLSGGMDVLGYEDEAFRNFVTSAGMVNHLLFDKELLDKNKVTSDEWKKGMEEHLPKMCSWLREGDNFCHLMEAADRNDEKLGKEPTSGKQIVDAMNAMNKLFKTGLPVKSLEKKYDFYKGKKAFKETAVDAYARGMYEYKLEQTIKANKWTPEQIQEVRDTNKYELVKDTAENKKIKEVIGKSQLINDFMATIKDTKSLDRMNAFAQKNNGADLYGYINQEKFRPADLNKQIEDAQKRIKNEWALLNPAGDPNAQKDAAKPEEQYPDKEKLRNDYAIIMTAHVAKSSMKEAEEKGKAVDPLTGGEFDHLVESMKRKNFFNAMMDLRSEKELYKNAVTGNGKNMNIDSVKALKQKKEIEKMEAIKAENLRKQQELNKNKPGAEMDGGKKK